MKKTVSILIVFAMLISNIAMAQDYSNIENSKYETPIKLLEALGIMSSDNPYGGITRGSFAAAAAKTMGYDGDTLSTGIKIFSDVDETSDTGKYIDILYNFGCISKAENFYPDRAISENEAVKLLASAMGAEAVAQEKGGYPSGYIYYAREAGILDNVEIDGDLTKAETALMLYNALNTNIYYSSELEYNNGSFSIYQTEPLMYKVFKMRVGSGIVTGNNTTRLYSSKAVSEGYIEIDNSIYLTNDTAMNEYLGYDVEFYYVEDRPYDKIVLCVPIARNNVTVINSENITDAADYAVKYYNHNRKEATIKFDVNTDYILNGKCAVLSSHSELEIPNGKLTLIDNDSDRIIDVILSDSYINYVVSAYSQGKIYSKYNRNVIDLDSLERRGVKIANAEELKSVKEWNVLSVYSDAFKVVNGETLCDFENSEVIRIEIGTAAVNGRINSKSDEEIKIENIVYSYSDGVYDRLISEQIGFEICDFYFDAHNKLAAFEISASSDWKAAIFAGITSSDTFGSKIDMKLFTENGKWEVLTLNERVTLDGTRDDCMEIYKNWTASTAQLIRYKTNEAGLITYIDLAGTSEEDTLSKDKTLSSRKYRTGSATFEGQSGVATTTKLFLVPGDPSLFAMDTANEEKFKYYANARNYLSNNTEFNVELYNIDEAYVSKYIVCYTKSNANTTAKATSTVAIFDSYQTVMNDEGNHVYSMKYHVLLSGAATEKEANEDLVIYKVESDSNVSMTINDLKMGDIIRIDATTGVIDAIEYVASLDTTTPVYSNSLILKGGQSGYVQQIRVTSGRIYAKNDTHYSVYYGNDIESLASSTDLYSQLEAQLIPTVITVYNRAEQTVAKGSAADITSYLSTNNPDEFVLIYQDYGTPKSITIVR